MIREFNLNFTLIVYDVSQTSPLKEKMRAISL